MSELLALAERCEKATGRDRELDQRIFAAVNGWSYPLVGAAFHSFNDRPHDFTGSIEPALSLIPAQLYWLIGKGKTRPSEPLFAIQILHAETNAVVAEAESNHLEGCICAGAIRARAAEVRG